MSKPTQYYTGYYGLLKVTNESFDKVYEEIYIWDVQRHEWLQCDTGFSVIFMENTTLLTDEDAFLEML